MRPHEPLRHGGRWFRHQRRSGRPGNPARCIRCLAPLCESASRNAGRGAGVSDQTEVREAAAAHLDDALDAIHRGVCLRCSAGRWLGVLITVAARCSNISSKAAMWGCPTLPHLCPDREDRQHCDQQQHMLPRIDVPASSTANLATVGVEIGSHNRARSEAVQDKEAPSSSWRSQ